MWVNAMHSYFRRIAEEPMEKWGLPSDGNLRHKYMEYKADDRLYWDHYDFDYVNYYNPPPPKRESRYGSAYEMFINGPFGEE